MMFAVPDLAEFTEEQLAVLALPCDGSHLVVGGPGSGKTALAVCRTDLLLRAGLPTTLLMYNKVLSSYTRTAVTGRGIDDTVVSTYQKWFHHFWRGCFNESPPMADRWEVDWIACMTRAGRPPLPATAAQYLVVDEGQDLPQQFYLLLRMLGARITVFADDNQRISAQQSTVAEIRAATGVKTPLRLSGHFRNSAPIAALADHFRPRSADPADPVPADTHGPGALPQLMGHERRADSVDHLIKLEARHPGDTIGVLLFRTADVWAFHGLLTGATLHPLQAYVHRDPKRRLPELRFTEPGIKLLTWASAKGLQFDTVVLPELQTVPGDPDTDNVRMPLYVVITRARERLVLMYSGSGEPELVRHLPRHLVEATGPPPRLLDGHPGSPADRDRGVD